MPRNEDIDSILIIGSGPIVIGQACEFDYSGAQACKALKEEGLRVILLNSNPATIMTDPELADATYVEPLTVDILDKILAKEKPKAILPTLGGQTGLNLALEASDAGVLEKHNVLLVGASVGAIRKAEDRFLFKQAMESIGLSSPKSYNVNTLEQARECVGDIGFPAIIRPSFTLGGSGGAIAYNKPEFDRLAQRGLDLSPVSQILVEQSVLGFKEYEMEVMRDQADNVVIICTIENLDPMGVHTGDSITVAPSITLTDKEYQKMRDASIKIIREIGVDTGGSNIQFSVDPNTGEQLVIEMNPRVSRSSALASKATGFPIAKIAAKLAIGYHLDELKNDITKVTPACFEPTIDYIVVKMPRFTFEKFPQAQPLLGTQMKSVGEAMAIGRTFREALGKAIRSLETGRFGFDMSCGEDFEELCRLITTPGPTRIFQLVQAMTLGLSAERAHELTGIDPWFLAQLDSVVAASKELQDLGQLSKISRETLLQYKKLGFSDVRIAALLKDCTQEHVRKKRYSEGIHPVYKRVDTCSAEFSAHTPYLYSTYETECEANPSSRHKVIILGGGPNRIGQGIEFDYCCVHAAFALKEEGVESIMINCNPETVSTDYDTSDRLYFEPLTLEDVLEICRIEKPDGVIVQFGGQTPLKLAVPLAKQGIPILGTSPDAIDQTEDRERFGEILKKLDIRAPEWGTAHSLEQALDVANSIGFPVMVRPSYVLGGRAMQRIYDTTSLKKYFTETLPTITSDSSSAFPLLIDQFLPDAVEIDVDVICDKTGAVMVGGIMEHIEEAGIHSGDSACSLPPYSLDKKVIAMIGAQARAMAKELEVVGLMNVQMAVHEGNIYVLEVNPRASRTIPFVSKSVGVPLAKIATKVMLGQTLASLGVGDVSPQHVSVKESVFPFVKFDDVDPILGPEMLSTGEVMGIDKDFVHAFYKAQLAAGTVLPSGGLAFLSVKDSDKIECAKLAKKLSDHGFSLVATHGTAKFLQSKGINCKGINKVLEGRPHCVDSMESGDIHLVVNTTEGTQAIFDSRSLRRAALMASLPYFTTMRGAWAAIKAITALSGNSLQVQSLQNHHQGDA